MSDYSGYADDRYYDMERLRERQESRRVQFIGWESDRHNQINQSNLQPSCEFDSRILIAKGNNWFCPDCGNETPINPKPVAKPKKFKPKQPGGINPLIIASQPNKRKKRKGTEGDLELRQDLAMTGVIEYSDIQEY